MKYYPLDYPEPYPNSNKCKCCGYYLGIQNPGDTCGTCKFIQSEVKRLK